MADLHVESHLKLGALLIDQGLIHLSSAEEALERGCTRTFYPHGIGHMLGLLVHDVAGKQVDRLGSPGKPDPRFPTLRSLRVLEENHILTVEPGLYFIHMLLDEKRHGSASQSYNWKKIDLLSGHGGIRIEDNVLVTARGA